MLGMGGYATATAVSGRWLSLGQIVASAPRVAPFIELGGEMLGTELDLKDPLDGFNFSVRGLGSTITY